MFIRSHSHTNHVCVHAPTSTHTHIHTHTHTSTHTHTYIQDFSLVNRIPFNQSIITFVSHVLFVYIIKTTMAWLDCVYVEPLGKCVCVCVCLV
jgi:hypothetical protein